jgi:hypothetical protein
MNPKIAFVHFGKAAGVTTNVSFSKAAHAAGIPVFDSWVPTKERPKMRRDWTPDELAQISEEPTGFVHQHHVNFHEADLKRFQRRGWFVFSFVRDPREVFPSLYHWARKFETPPLPPGLGVDGTLDDFVRSAATLRTAEILYRFPPWFERLDHWAEWSLESLADLMKTLGAGAPVRRKMNASKSRGWKAHVEAGDIARDTAALVEAHPLILDWDRRVRSGIRRVRGRYLIENEHPKLADVKGFPVPPVVEHEPTMDIDAHMMTIGPGHQKDRTATAFAILGAAAVASLLRETDLRRIRRLYIHADHHNVPFVERLIRAQCPDLIKVVQRGVHHRRIVGINHPKKVKPYWATKTINKYQMTQVAGDADLQVVLDADLLAVGQTPLFELLEKGTPPTGFAGLGINNWSRKRTFTTRAKHNAGRHKGPDDVLTWLEGLGLSRKKFFSTELWLGAAILSTRRATLTEAWAQFTAAAADQIITSDELVLHSFASIHDLPLVTVQELGIPFLMPPAGAGPYITNVEKHRRKIYQPLLEAATA